MAPPFTNGGVDITRVSIQPFAKGWIQNHMFYVYVLKSESANRFYIGRTNDLKRRWAEHCQGKVYSTHRFTPWKLVYYEAYLNREQSIERETKLKQYGSSYKGLLKRIGYK